MRPIRRGASPRGADFEDYVDAKPDLVARLGPYCSFCERKVSTQLAVEHIQPKGLPSYSGLKGRWDNFLLACVNCNSTKKDKDVRPEDLLLPDRDNTFLAYSYSPNGTLEPSPHARGAGVESMAVATLRLTGLDRPAIPAPDANGRQVALDRVRQRMEAWLTADSARADLESDTSNTALRANVARLAEATGFFSVWMSVFNDDSDMRGRFIRAFSGTLESGCFDPSTSEPVAPAPNPDQLIGGGKV